MFRTVFLPALCVVVCAAVAPALRAEPLSKKTDIDFYRDVPSRSLKGLATRSDGRLVAGPTLVELAAPAPADLLWALEPGAQPSKWLLGTGPDGRILEATYNAGQTTYTVREVAKLDDPQVLVLRRLPDGSVLAGTSPRGGLYLLKDDKPVARVGLPADSILDLLVVDAATVLVATGNPGRIYKLEVAKLAAGGVVADKLTDTKLLADRGLSVFGEVRDRNVRRLAALPDGRIVAGSSPRGNVYAFAAAGGAPVILQENRDAEITDLLPQPNGDFYATIVYSATTNESRITPPPAAAAGDRPAGGSETPALRILQPERFGGRSAILFFPSRGFPEVLSARGNTALYRLARHGDMLIAAGGEQGELVGYDLRARQSVTFAGSLSAQLNGIAPLPGTTDQFLVLRNNAPGLAVLDFAAAGPREAETRRLDLGSPALLGALRFNRLRNLAPAALRLEARVSQGTDDVEGWGPWTALAAGPDAGWRAPDLRGRYAKLRLRIPDAAPGAAALEIDRAALYGLPQNRRPQLQEFRVLTPGYAIVAAGESPPPVVTTLSQLTAAPKEDDRRRSSFLGSQVVPSPGTQAVLWNVTDGEGDTFVATFSIRRDGDETWTELVKNSRDTYAQFDTRPLSEGTYFTRLVVQETAPRAAADRLGHTFETDDLVVDHTPPEIVSTGAERQGPILTITLTGRDRWSLLEGIEVVFNNGTRETVEQPADGIRDGREETFTLEIPLARISNASSAEVTLYDAVGNSVSRRLGLIW